MDGGRSSKSKTFCHSALNCPIHDLYLLTFARIFPESGDEYVVKTDQYSSEDSLGTQYMDLFTAIVAIGILVGVGYLYIHAYWIDDPWLNSELFR